MKLKHSITLVAGLLIAATSLTQVYSENESQTIATNEVRLGNWKEFKKNFIKPSNQVLKQSLTPIQYDVTQKEGTERPFKNEYWDNKRAGIYVDIISGEPLFSSTDKYKSGTGWPSFTRPIQSGVLVEHKDRKLLYTRTELRSKLADSHLGHVFDDGPKPTGMRYCINSASLRFVPKEELAAQGYEEYVSFFE